MSKPETCVCCGEVIPEGRQVCPDCEWKARQRKDYVPESRYQTSSWVNRVRRIFKRKVTRR